MRKNIQMFWALYKKDLQQIRGIGLALVAYGTIVTATYYLLDFLPRYDIMLYSPLLKQFRNLAVAVPYVFPTLLAFILFQKRHDESRYSEQSLPVWRSMPIVTSYVALMTYVVIYAVIDQLLTNSLILADLIMRQHSFEITVGADGQNVAVSLWEAFRSMRVHLFWTNGVHFFISNLAGIVCLATGIASPFLARRWGWYWTAFTGTIAVIYGVPAIMTWFGYEIIPSWWIQGWLLPGPILVLAGAWLYGRFAQV